MTKEEKKEYLRQYRLKNKESIKEKKKQYYLDNKEKLSEYKKLWCRENPEYFSQYYLDNKEKIKDYSKRYRKENREYYRELERNRYNSDPLYRFKKSLRVRTRIAFKRKSWKKNGGTEKLLGCDYKTAMKHIESQFESWMTWDNYGKWHIDHIIPLASAKTKKEIEQLCHYTNLQPLLAEENIRKGDTILN